MALTIEEQHETNDLDHDILATREVTFICGCKRVYEDISACQKSWMERCQRCPNCQYKRDRVRGKRGDRGRGIVYGRRVIFRAMASCVSMSSSSPTLGLAAFAVVGSLVSLKRHSMWTNNPPVPYGIGGFFISNLA